jgi:hypothetical protein
MGWTFGGSLATSNLGHNPSRCAERNTFMLREAQPFDYAVDAYDIGNQG